MALIDVSDLMTDPDFINKFIIVRRAARLNDFGENEVFDCKINALGSVQAGNGDTLQRLPEGAQLSDTMTVFSKTEFKVNDVGSYADIIEWQGKRYQVLNVSPWGNYGRGWFRADCVMEKASL